MLGPNVQKFGDIQIGPALEPMQLQDRLHEVLDMLVESCVYKSGCSDEPSKATRQRECMRLISSALNFAADDATGGATPLRQDAAGCIRPDDLVYVFLEADNPLHSWFTTMLGPAHRRAFLQFCVQQAGLESGDDLQRVEKIGISFLLKVIEECIRFRL